MKNIFLIYVLGFMSMIGYSQEDCTSFKVGEFQNIENGIIKSKIRRNDSIQTEQYGRKEIKLKIVWIDDCTYRLKFLEGNEAFWSSRSKGRPTPDLIVRITEINGNKYLQESKFDVDKDFTYKSEITKIQ